jgi:hypothetical protein
MRWNPTFDIFEFRHFAILVLTLLYISPTVLVLNYFQPSIRDASENADQLRVEAKRCGYGFHVKIDGSDTKC